MVSIEIGGIKYLVVGVKAFTHKGAERKELTLRRLNGRRTYHAVVYENGAVSEAV